MNPSNLVRRMIRRPLRVSVCILTALLWASVSTAQTDPLTLQRNGIQRLEDYVENFRKTGDQQRLLPGMSRAASDLMASRDEFLRRGDEAAAALSAIKLGDVRRIQKQAQPALESFEQGERLASKANHKTNQVLAIQGRGRVYAYLLNDNRRAATQFAEAARLGAELPDRTHLFNALSDLGYMQAQQGDVIGAADTYNRAFTLTTELKDPKLLFFAHLDRGDIYGKLAEKCDYERTFEPCYEQLDLAKKDYLAALEIARHLGYDGLAATTESFLKQLEMRRQMFASTEQLAKKLQQSRIFHPAKPADVLVTENFVGDGLALPPGTITFLQQSGVLNVGDARSYFIRGAFHSMRREDQPALAAFQKSVELLEEDRRNLRDETGSRAFLDDRINYYYAPIELLLQARRFSEAFTLMEQSRSRAMTDLLFTKKLVLNGPEETALFARLQTVRSQIGALQQELFEVRSRAGNAGSAEQIIQTESEIVRLQKDYDRLRQEMERKAPNLQQLVGARPCSLAQLQQALKKDRADALYYLLVEQGVILWHINSEETHVRSVFLPRSEVISKVAALQKSLSQRNARFDDQTAKELFLYLIQPALGWIKSKHLIIIPHEDLHYVPFQVFLDPAGQSAGEMFQITYAPNATLLAQMKPGRALAEGRLLAVADQSIEDQSQEIEGMRLKELYPGRHTVLMNASEAEFKRQASQYELLHLSVHGIFNSSQPLLSHLKLKPGESDDGQLTAAEIFGLPLDRCRLVVLSACESGQAVATHANELLGMQRALLYAGADGLVLSAWKVDAGAAGLWMQTFYREAQRKTPAEAARLSLIEVKKKYPHPRDWAVFQIVGR